VVSIHNLAFLGLFGREMLPRLGLPDHAFTFDGVEFHGHLCYLKAGLQTCDRIATVSPTYAREILDPAFGNGLDGLLRYRRDRIHGILNGIDTAIWNPATDTSIARTYAIDTLERKRENRRDLQARMGLAPQDTMPVIGVVSRLTEQKGLDLLLELADGLCERGLQFAVLGSGEPWLQAGWQALAARQPGRCAVTIGFDEALAHRIEAGADLFAMPSRFEPCGLNQMYSLRYGTPPIVRRTGGLADTVVDTVPGNPDGNGFVFDAPTAAALSAAIERALMVWSDPAAWRRVQQAGMRRDFGWDSAAGAYLTLYRAALADRAAASGR
jgi:starch synthase